MPATTMGPSAGQVLCQRRLILCLRYRDHAAEKCEFCHLQHI